MAAFWAVFTFGGSGPAITAHGSLDLKQEIQIQIQTVFLVLPSVDSLVRGRNYENTVDSMWFTDVGCAWKKNILPFCSTCIAHCTKLCVFLFYMHAFLYTY
jgi:hypothetical protein